MTDTKNRQMRYYERNREKILQQKRDARRIKREPIAGNRYWLTPPDLYARLDAKYQFDFDPCPYPRPDGFNSLSESVSWGKSNYVNPPFRLVDAPFGGIAKFADRIIKESKRGNKSVVILPCSTGVGKLIAAGAKVIGAETVAFLERDTHEPAPFKQWQIILEIG